MSTRTLNTRRLRRGVEITIRGQGRYRFMRLRPNGIEFDCWGPIDTNGNCPRGRVRSFHVDNITVVHRKERGR